MELNRISDIFRYFLADFFAFCIATTADTHSAACNSSQLPRYTRRLDFDADFRWFINDIVIRFAQTRNEKIQQTGRQTIQPT